MEKATATAQPSKQGLKNTQAQEHEMIQMNKIKLGKNSRTKASEALEGLVQSISEIGLLQPIGLIKQGSGYEVICGNRRFLACSTLGWTKIPAVIHHDKTEAEIDIMNMAENIQRRNISPIEVGRYVKHLMEEQDMKTKDICAFLGVNRTFVSSCLTAYQEVPKAHQADIVLGSQAGKNRGAAEGKIPMDLTRAILTARRNYDLKGGDLDKLFTLAKQDKNINVASVKKYASAIKSGKDPLKAVEQIHPIHMTFFISDSHRLELEGKHVNNGPFRTIKGLFEAILKGEKSVRVEILR